MTIKLKVCATFVLKLRLFFSGQPCLFNRWSKWLDPFCDRMRKFYIQRGKSISRKRFRRRIQAVVKRYFFTSKRNDHHSTKLLLYLCWHYTSFEAKCNQHNRKENIYCTFVRGRICKIVWTI